jgi:hypothetical protein
MGNKFREHLKKDVKLSESRVYDLDRAIDSLHSAICFLDIDNGDIIKNVGLEKLITDYCRIEELRDITYIIFPEDREEKTETEIEIESIDSR